MQKHATSKIERLSPRLVYARNTAILFLYNGGYDVSELVVIFKMKRQHIEYIIKNKGTL